jgi:hypothetical protein
LLSMNFFSKNEFIGVSAILIFIFVASALNMRVSLRRARDARREGDISVIFDSLNNYKEINGSYPLASADGRILACIGPETKKETVDGHEEVVNWAPCRWGLDGFSNLKTLSKDPQSELGIAYFYKSNGARFQLYSSLEGEDEAEYSAQIANRGWACGSRICNFGKSSPQTPLDKTLEEYENELEKEISN